MLSFSRHLIKTKDAIRILSLFKIDIPRSLVPQCILYCFSTKKSEKQSLTEIFRSLNSNIIFSMREVVVSPSASITIAFKKKFLVRLLFPLIKSNKNMAPSLRSLCQITFILPFILYKNTQLSIKKLPSWQSLDQKFLRYFSTFGTHSSGEP